MGKSKDSVKAKKNKSKARKKEKENSATRGGGVLHITGTVERPKTAFVQSKKDIAAQNQDNAAAPPAPPQTKKDWLQKDSRNPYVKLKKETLKRINPIHQSIYMKYVRKDTNKRCSGGVIVQNKAPVYIKLRNPYTKAEFSVQVPDVQLYIRSTDLQALEDM